ncbi:MAG: DUF7133 domain-containing protein, partial [Verrucomicrobiales bacterium]
GDGKADNFTRFAEKLSIPTTLAFTHGGVICTNGDEVLFLKDTNGDDRADLRLPLFKGISTGDTHAGVSNFRAAPDNWIYATIGYAGFKGTVGGQQHQFSQGLFRFKVDLPENPKAGSDGTLQEYCQMEFLQPTTNNTWGLTFSSHFDILGSTANANPSWYFTFPRETYAAAGLRQGRTPRADDNPMFFPSSMDIRQVDQFDRYTSAAGHALYTATRFPEDYQEKTAFICGPTGKLVGNFQVTPNAGSGFTATQSPNNLYNSADAWSAPVCAEVGPDGAVWICDWYNLVVQHNPTPNKNNSGLAAQNGKGNAYQTPHRDKQHGRIYRVFPKNSPDDSPPTTLVGSLSHPNQFWRLTSQRLLSESASTQHVPALQKLIANAGAEDHAGLHAFGVLQKTGQLDLATITAALQSPHHGLRRAALRVAPLDDTLVRLFINEGRLNEDDPRTKIELLLALGRLAASPQVAEALHAEISSGTLQDQTLGEAWKVAARPHAADLLLASELSEKNESAEVTNLLPNPGFTEALNGKPAAWGDLRIYSGSPRAELAHDPTGGRDGSPALRISSTQASDSGAALSLRVEPDTRYEFSAWIRTEKLTPVRNSPGALINIHGGGRSGAVKGDSDWTRVSLDFTTASGQREILVHCLFGGYGGATGTAWWDDLSLIKTGGGNPTENALHDLAVHYGKTASPSAKEALIAKLAAKKSPFAALIASQTSTAPKRERKFKIDPEIHERGQAVYNLTCIACHGPDGNGVEGAFPPINGADWLTGDPEIPAKIILRGLQGPVEVKGKSYNSIMPPLVDLTDQQIADVLTYARQNWENDARPVSADEIKKIRAATQSQKLPYTAKELKP